VTFQKNLVPLTFTACCALHCAFEHYPKLAKDLAKFVPPEIIAVFRDILENTGRLIFIPNTDAAVIYGTLASKELEGLHNVDSETELSCGHIVGEHKEALKSVVKSMETSNN